LRRLGWTPQYPTFGDAMEKSVLLSFANAISGASHLTARLHPDG
jgi:hypothetical protein